LVAIRGIADSGKPSARQFLWVHDLNIAEGGYAEFRIYNEHDDPIASFGFADEHEARIARALMIRAIANAVLIIGHRSVRRRDSDFVDDAITELKRLAHLRK
jgi:hypothetical protein